MRLRREKKGMKKGERKGEREKREGETAEEEVRRRGGLADRPPAGAAWAARVAGAPRPGGRRAPLQSLSGRGR